MCGDLSLISAADTAATVQPLDYGDEPAAIRYLNEAVSRLIQAPDGAMIPDAILEVPLPIDDARYSTLIATAFAYAMGTRGEAPWDWTSAVKSLVTEWLWDGDSSTSEDFTVLVRRDTPTIFRDKNILPRPNDWVTR